MWRAYKEFWRHYTDFKGFSSRSDYWWVQLMNFLIALAIFAVILGIGLAIGNRYSDSITLVGVGGVVIAMVFAMLYNLIVLIPSIALGVRRVRDTGLSAWWYLLSPIGASLMYLTDAIKGYDWLMIVGGVLLLAYFVIVVTPSDKY
jgi:uncharacterized membrane protein YhaH (DUF805 family)